jgi:cytochrome c peroxidase
MRGEKNAISLAEEVGFRLFNKVGCGNCHNGPMFSDYLPHVIGVPANKKLEAFDQGIDDKYAFRTASLRNLRFTAPYMHNGRFNSLKEVLEFYEDIADGKNLHDEVGKNQLDTLINELDLTVKEIGPIISFLNTLSDSNFDKTIPESVPSGLPVGGNIH